MLPLSAPSCALDTKSWLEVVERNSLPNGPAPCAAKGEPGAALRWPSSSTLKLSISEGRVAAPTPVPMRVPTRWVGSVTIEEYVANHSSARQCEGRILHRTEVTVVEPEPGVTADWPVVTDEDQIIVDGDGDRCGPAG